MGGRGAQSRVARLAGITPQYLNDILSGRSDGTEEKRRNIAAAIGLPYEVLLEVSFFAISFIQTIPAWRTYHERSSTKQPPMTEDFVLHQRKSTCIFTLSAYVLANERHESRIAASHPPGGPPTQAEGNRTGKARRGEGAGRRKRKAETGREQAAEGQGALKAVST